MSIKGYFDMKRSKNLTGCSTGISTVYKQHKNELLRPINSIKLNIIHWAYGFIRLQKGRGYKENHSEVSKQTIWKPPPESFEIKRLLSQTLLEFEPNLRQSRHAAQRKVKCHASRWGNLAQSPWAWFHKLWSHRGYCSLSFLSKPCVSSPGYQGKQNGRTKQRQGR